MSLFSIGEPGPDMVDAAIVGEEKANKTKGGRGLRKAMRRDAAALKVDQIVLVRSRLAKSASGHLSRAADKIVQSPVDRLSNEDYTAFTRSTTHAARLSAIDSELRTLEKRYAKRAAVKVTREPGPYTKGSPNSWICDMFASADESGFTVGRVASGHEERLRRHGEDVSRAVRKRTKYGRMVERSWQEQYRQADVFKNRELATKGLAELRALATGGGTTASASGGGAAAFVAPAILLESWAEYRSPYRAFADQCNDSALPSYGLNCYVPSVSTGTTVATQVEGSAVAESDPVTTLLQGAVVDKAGQIEVSQAFLDRAGPGISGDQILFAQIKEQLDAQVDAYAIAQAIANAQTQTWTGNSGSFALNVASGVGGFLGQLYLAKKTLHDTAGVRIRATHAFTIGDVADYIAAFSDASGRPIFTPTFDDNRLPIRSTGDQMAGGYTGYVLSGLALFADDNIPTLGTTSTSQVIVTRPDTILLLEGAPTTYLYPQGAAGNLEAVLGVKSYVACIPRFQSGVMAISGSALAASNFTTSTD